MEIDKLNLSLPLNFKKMKNSEINLLKDILCLLLGLPLHFNAWDQLYSIACEKLKNKINASSIDNAKELIDFVGLADLSDDFELFIINKVPESIIKITWGELKSSWDNIWCPPSDDGLLLYLPNNKLILLTHWDVIYYS